LSRRRRLQPNIRDAGDILVAEFDLTKNLALLQLGDDEVLEELSPEV